MTPFDLKQRLEEKVLLNPIVTEAVSMVNNGMAESHAFCWSSLKLVEENEYLKNQIVDLKRSAKFQSEDIDKLKNIIMDLKDELCLTRFRIESKKA